MSDLNTVVADALNQFVLEKVWNEPYSEYRENIRPKLLKKRSSVGTFQGLGQLIMPLPTSDIPYFVYGISDGDMCAHLTIPSNTWVSAVTLCNEYDILFSMYSHKGFMFHKSQVYVRYNQERSALYIAVAKPMMERMVDYEDVESVYFTVYYDSDIVSDITVYSLRAPVTGVTTTFLLEVSAIKATVQNAAHFTQYINGLEYPNNAAVVSPGDYIDFIVDTNVQFEFTIDLSDIANSFIYRSTKDNVYKYIIHIPKALNPDFAVITHNTCDIHVRQKSPLPGNIYRCGTYLHRCADVSVGQITHNDFSLPRSILDAFRDHIGSQDVELRVQVRIHDKDNVLLRDKSYIDLLYTHSDTEICKFLVGAYTVKYPKLSFWTANELEKTTYLKFMFEVFENIVPENISEYVDGLGFYHSLGLLCRRVENFTIPMNFDRSVRFSKPYMYQGYRIIPICYLNGRKIRQEHITHIQDDTTITVAISDSVYLLPADKLTILYAMTGNTDIVELKPTEANNAIVIPYDAFRIYEVVDRAPYTCKGVGTSSTIIYKDVTSDLGTWVTGVNADNTTFITFNEASFGKTFIIENDLCSHYQLVNIDDLVSTHSNLVIDLAKQVVNGTSVVPVINFSYSLVYLNGRYLTKDLDYSIAVIKDADGNVGLTQLILHSFEYLTNANNVVEIYLSATEQEDRSVGFVKRQFVYDSTPVNLWFPNISTCHAGGNLVVGNIIERGTYLELPDDSLSGKPFEVVTAVPTSVVEFIEQYHTNDDYARVVILNDYFYGKAPDLSGLLLIPDNHRLYSIFMNQVIYDIIYNDLGIADDPDAVRFKTQLLQYQYLFDLDIGVSNTEIINSDFIDLYPSYAQYTTTAEKYAIIRRFIEIYLPADTVTSGGDYYE